MKRLGLKLVIAGCFISFSNTWAQSFSLLRGLDKAIANKVAFNKAINSVEEKENRFFYKKSNTAYIFAGTDSDLDADNKSYTDIQLSRNSDTIIAKTYTYQMFSKSFVLSATIHGEEKDKRMIYKRIKEDVYVAIEDSDKIKYSVPSVTYLLYNTTNGLYYHRFFYKVERKYLNQKQYNYLYIAYDGHVRNAQYNVTYGDRFFYPNGSGLYKQTKKEKLNKQELEDSKNSATVFDAKVIKAGKDATH